MNVDGKIIWKTENETLVKICTDTIPTWESLIEIRNEANLEAFFNVRKGAPRTKDRG